MAVVGADGCRTGWFAVRREDDGQACFDVFESVADLWDQWGDASLLLLDIPIGLTDSKEPRRCDAVARRLLGRRRSSVFTPPCRAAIEASNYETASAVNFRETGRKLSMQSWNIVPKIREVDRLVRENPRARSRVREVHPEVCFWALAGGAPMNARKKSREGREERLRLLRRLDAATDAIVHSAQDRFLRREVATDDILDALVAVLTADRNPRELSSLPAEAQMDAYGLQMEMVYCARGW